MPNVHHIDLDQFAHIAEHLGITKEEVFANWERGVAEQRATEKRIKRLQAMARRRGCYFTEIAVENEEAEEGERAFLLYVLHYEEPIDFDDLDEVEFDLNSRPTVPRAESEAARTNADGETLN